MASLVKNIKRAWSGGRLKQGRNSVQSEMFSQCLVYEINSKQLLTKYFFITFMSQGVNPVAGLGL